MKTLLTLLLVTITLLTSGCATWLEEMTTRQGTPRCYEQVCLGPNQFVRRIPKRELDRYDCAVEEQFLYCQSAVGTHFDCQCVDKIGF